MSAYRAAALLAVAALLALAAGIGAGVLIGHHPAPHIIPLNEIIASMHASGAP